MTPKTAAFAVLSTLVLAGPVAAEETPVVGNQGMYLGLEPLESCVSRWDAGTNMTKEEWRESCKRISDERGTYLREQGIVPDGE